MTHEEYMQISSRAAFLRQTQEQILGEARQDHGFVIVHEDTPEYGEAMGKLDRNVLALLAINEELKVLDNACVKYAQGLKMVPRYLLK